MLQSTPESKQSFSVFFKRALTTNPIEFKKAYDNSIPFGFTITVYASKIQGMHDLIVLTMDEKPGKIYTLVHSATNSAEMTEVDEQFKIILEKIKLYTITQTVTVKGTEYSWNFSDYTLRYFTYSSTMNAKKYTFLELSSPFVFLQEKKKQEQEQQKLFKFASEMMINTDSSIASLGTIDVNPTEMARFKNYLKHFYIPFGSKFFQ
jgi:hypothetical protein